MAGLGLANGKSVSYSRKEASSSCSAVAYSWLSLTCVLSLEVADHVLVAGLTVLELCSGVTASE